MKQLRIIWTLAIWVLFSLVLSSCGGGGGGSGSNSTSSSNSSISGTAAVGAPIANATVIIYDSTGAVVGNTTTDENGQYAAVVNGGTAPYLVEINGGVGDSFGRYYAVSDATGNVNVNQVSNAVASTLSSTGDPADLSNSLSGISSSIKTIENAFMSAFSNVLTAFGVSGSLISGTFNTSIDEVLDMIDAVILPDGTIELSSSEGQPMPDIMGTFDTNNTPVAHKINILPKGVIPSSSLVNNIPAPTQSVIATAQSLEPLRAKLEKCFSYAASERATQASASNTSPSWTSINADCQNLAVDDSSSNGFKHESLFWIDNSSLNSKNVLSGCSFTGSTFCLGFFGAMLTSTNYNNLKFLKPTHIAPIDTNIWRVQFPVIYNDGVSTRGQFGDAIGSSYMVVKYDALSQSFKFFGNQRDLQTTIQPSVNRAQRAGTDNYRIETGFNIYVNPYNSRSLKKPNGTQVFPIKALVTPIFPTTGMIPANGIYLANKVNRNPSTVAANIGVTSNQSSTFNVCTFMNYEDPNIIDTSVNNGTGTYTVANLSASPCSGVIRMNYAEYVMSNGKLVFSNGAYTPTNISNAGWITGWAPNGGALGSGSLITQATARRGEPYLFTVTMSDGSVIRYINRMPTSTLTTEQAARLDYPNFTSDMSTKFASYNGSTNNTLSVTWNPMKTALIFADAFYWNRGEVNSTSKMGSGVTSNSISCPTTLTNYVIKNYDSDNVNALDCRDSLNWKSSSSSTPNQGVLQLKARTFDGLFIQSQLRQY